MAPMVSEFDDGGEERQQDSRLTRAVSTIVKPTTVASASDELP